jgi:ribosomal protein L40E
LDYEKLLWQHANPCVHCGSTSLRFHHYDKPMEQDGSHSDFGAVICNGCGAQGPLIDAAGLTEIDESWFAIALAAWNHRA